MYEETEETKETIYRDTASGPMFREGNHELFLPNDDIADIVQERWRWKVRIEVTRESLPYDHYVANVFCTIYDNESQFHPFEDPIYWGAQMSIEDENGNKYFGCLKQDWRNTKVSYEWFKTEYPTTFPCNFKLKFEMKVSNPRPRLATEFFEAPKSSPSKSVCGVSDLVQSFGSLLTSGLLSDVKLRTNEGDVAAHRIILAARSDFFKTKFKPEWQDRGDADAIVDVSDVSLKVLQEMLNYIYTGRYEENVNLIELMVAADKYLITGLCNEIKIKLEESLESGNPIAPVCDLLKISTTHKSTSLRTFALMYMKKHPQVFKSTEWKNFQITHHTLAAEALLEMVNLPD